MNSEAEGEFLLMSLGFIVCALLFIIYGQPLTDNRIENIVNTFNLVIVIYVVLSLHILHPASWGKYAVRIFLGYIVGTLLKKFYYKDN
jgi:hypothetical protein